MNRRLGLNRLASFALLAYFAPSLWAHGSEYYFPHAVDGRTGSIFYSTSFLFNNTSTSNNVVVVKFFRSNGTDWVIDLRSVDRVELGGRVASVTFTLAPRETVELYTGGVDPLASGWVKVESELPMVASEVFQVFRGTPPITASEAGVLASPNSTQFSLYATMSQNEPVTGTHIDTGFAFANPSASQATISATLYSRSGSQVGLPKTITVDANSQRAIFASQVFSDVSFSGIYHALIKFSSNVNVAMVALRQTYGNSDTISTIAATSDADLLTGIAYDREPNDTIGTAHIFSTVPGEIIGTMNTPGDGPDRDVFGFPLTAGQVLYVTTVADLMNSPLDDNIRILNSAGTIVAENEDSSTGLRDPFVRYLVPSNGTYYVDHASVGGTSSRGAHYRLHIRVK